MAIEKTFTAEAQYGAPLLVGGEQKVQYEVNVSTPPLNGTVSLQRITGRDDPARPDDANSAWATLLDLEVSGTNVAGTYDGGKGWYRLAVLSGNYTSGQATAKINAG